MITTTNNQIIAGLPFDDYLKIPAYSHSGLKGGAPYNPTPTMQLGTRVDNFLFEPELYDGQDYKIVKACADVVRGIIGKGRPQVQVVALANLEHNGKVMPAKGRLDMLMPNLVIDMKVSKMNIVDSVKHFRYDWQLTGYALMAQVTRALIISVNPVTFKPQMLNVPLAYDWWEYQINLKGTNILNHKK